MIKSLFSGVTGLKTHNQRMDVIGNNIANVNTTAFKAGTVTFRDVYYQTRQTASGGSFTQGGVNPMQVGYGVQLGTIGKVMTQSGLTFSDSVLDCALVGSGFFQVMDQSGNIFFTRLGRFSIDDFGNLTDANGNIVLGVTGDPTNVPASQQRINIRVPDIEDATARTIEEYEGHEIVIQAGGIGPGGNISITIVPSDVSFAVTTGSTLRVYMDLTTDYESLAMYGRDGSAPVPAGPGGTPAAVPAVFGAGAMGPRPVEGVALTAQQLTVVGGAARPATSDDVAAWNQAFTERVSELFSQDLQEAIRLGGVNVDPTILSFNPDGTINAENSINISFNTVPQVTAAQPANNHLRISDDYRLMFTVRNPGSFGNRYEINVETHSGDGVLAQWSGNVLTVRIPADGSVTQENIQTAINRAAAGRPDFYIDVEVQNTDGTITGITPATNLNPPPVAPATSRDMTAFINGRTLPVSLNNGTNSFFQEAFFSLTTMRLDGGAVRTPQDVSSVVLEIGRDGVIYGYHPVHKMLLLGRIDIVDFVNPEGLQQVGTSYFVETMASGPPQVNIPQTDSSTEVVSCALEMSNVDLSQEFSDMIITQRGFQANSRIITVSDSMLEELVNLKR